MPMMAGWTVTRKANAADDGGMFAPYCPTCRTRRLLGSTRIVASDWDAGGSITLRCTCGTVVDATARPPSASEQLPEAS
jgi:hypothetical protein